MELSRLQVFLAVMDSRNFARAADLVGISQPAISKNIKKLEDHLDVKLFERGRHGAEPTKYAQAIEQRAKLLLTESRLIQGEVEALRDSHKGQLMIGGAPPFMPKILPEALYLFRRRWPDVHINIDHGLSPNLFPALERGEFDFIVSLPPAQLLHSELTSIELMYKHEQRLVIRRDHPLSETDHISLEQLAEYPWIVTRGLGNWKKISSAFLMAGLEPPKIAAETSSDTLTKAMITQDNYICALNNNIFALEEKNGILIGISHPSLFEPRQAYITYRRRSPLSAPARNMIEIIKNSIKQSIGDDSKNGQSPRLQ
ncbi:LysR family transcriptional regulator [Sphingorhabdus sp. EL138]|uniref:LysR family transcriptional regulator n=1 Tax=Sphingorhabdus sp. EL138 TaxID=2073156 RepID=UPI000D69A519|nr:LysR family transcriptional regulator [Sphingorhabdus sp. EL138]